jgi:hypothetical protein
MEKQELRPVEWTEYIPASNIIGEKSSPARREKYKGYFHLWRKQVSEDGSEYVTAIIEDESGQIHRIPIDNYYEIRFLDRKPALGNVESN